MALGTAEVLMSVLEKSIDRNRFEGGEHEYISSNGVPLSAEDGLQMTAGP